MTSARALNIGGIHFSSIRVAAALCRRILNQYEPPAIITGDDAVFVRTLFERHPEAAKKSEKGICHFEVRRRKHGAKCFHVVHPDGTATEFSYKKCLS